MEEKYLRELYYDPESPANFGGVDSIYHAVKNDAKYQISRNKIRSWLQNKTHILSTNQFGIASSEIAL